MKKIFLVTTITAFILCILIVLTMLTNSTKDYEQQIITDTQNSYSAEMIDDLSKEDALIPIQIEYLKSIEYPGSKIVIEQELSSGSNYKRYIASYYSEGLKQYGLLTIPNTEKPNNGFPAIIFNHGYIAPEEYKTTERYVAYTDAFSKNGYVMFKPDYRGHGNSEGIALGGYGNSDYIIDVLNAVSSISQMPEVNSNKIGMWGHSMGGWITHRSMVVSKDIKAGVIWAGMVGGYNDLLELREPYWVRQGIPEPTIDLENPRRRWRSYLIEEYGEPQENQEFWNSISAVSYLSNLSGPIQLHHATGDISVPFSLSERFYSNLKNYSSESELYIYNGDDHNITENFDTAMQRSLSFFDTYLK